MPEQQRVPEPRTAANAVTVQEIIDRISSEHEAEGRPSPVLNHAAPRGPITVEYARILMRQHRPCHRDECPAKRCAFALLVDKGIMSPSPSGRPARTGKDSSVVNDEDLARELSALHADTTAAINTATPDDMTGPIVLANGMWANRWNMLWRVTEDRGGDCDKPARFVAVHLDECRRWAGARLRDSKH